MRMRTSILAGVVVAAALARAGGAIGVAAQTHEHTDVPAAATAATQPADAMKMHDQMMATMRARQDKLDSLVKTMDGATGAVKIETMAAIIRALVQDEKDMHARMDMMHQHMMPASAPTH